MKTRIGIACDSGTGRSAPGSIMVKRAMASGGIERPDLVLAFCTNKADPKQFFSGIREVVGKSVPIVGGSAVGVISNDLISYQGSAEGIMVLQSDAVKFRISAAGGLDGGEKDAGKKVAGTLSPGQDDKLLLIFYDSIRVSPTQDLPPSMNSSAPLLAGIDEVLGQSVPVLGAGLIGDYSFNETTQFCDSRAGSQQVTALMLGGRFSFYHRIMHGCTPLDGVYHRVTKVEGPVLLELDGRPVVEMIDEMFGDDQWHGDRPLDFLTIGIHCGEKYTGYRENDYVNRLIAGVTPDKSGVIMFEPDLMEGDEVQFMVRDTERMVESARMNSRLLVDTIMSEDKEPLLALYIDCAGRAKDYSNTSVEEASEVQKVLGQHNIPLFGFYSGVEIAPLLGKSRGLDWTGVLIVLVKDA